MKCRRHAQPNICCGASSLFLCSSRSYECHAFGFCRRSSQCLNPSTSSICSMYSPARRSRFDPWPTQPGFQSFVKQQQLRRCLCTVLQHHGRYQRASSPADQLASTYPSCLLRSSAERFCAVGSVACVRVSFSRRLFDGRRAGSGSQGDASRSMLHQRDSIWVALTLRSYEPARGSCRDKRPYNGKQHGMT